MMKTTEFYYSPEKEEYIKLPFVAGFWIIQEGDLVKNAINMKSKENLTSLGWTILEVNYYEQ